MSFFNALQLLTDAAQEYQHERETFSTAEIAGRINEIKYLSAQKKVPKLSLRKEIIHLENKLATVAEVEKRLAKHKKQDSVKEKALKHRIKELQSRLAAAEDKDVQKKLERVTHLLGDYLAKKATEEDVKAAIAEIEAGKKENVKKEKARSAEGVLLTKSTPSPLPAEDMQPRIKELQQRLELMKGELELLKVLKKDARASGVAEKIMVMEQRLDKYRTLTTIPAISTEKIRILPPTAPVVEKKEIKHTMLFTPAAEKVVKPVEMMAPPPEESPAQKIVIEKPEITVEKPAAKRAFLFAPPAAAPAQKPTPQKSDEDLELEAELPLPPPPKMKK